MLCITICTRERPEMLRRVLESCKGITSDVRSQIQFIIIENGPKESAHSIVLDFSSCLDIKYIHEPEIGIVNARNAGIEAFLETDADWMATADDDVTLCANWLTAMLDAIENYPECKVFAGPQHRIIPEEANQWLAGKPKPNPETGTSNWNVSTANALFKRAVFAQDQMNLKFHPMFNLSGGEDVCLFYQLKDLGEDILWVREAECFEPMVYERTRFETRGKRAVQQAQNWGKTLIIRFGALRGGANILRNGLSSFVNVFTFGLLGILLSLVNRKKGKEMLNKSLTSGCFAIGYFKALFFPQGEIYRNIDGE